MKKSIIASVFASFILFSCQSKGLQQENKTQSVDKAIPAVVAISDHNSKNSLDWAGEYVGTLPCADCEGIKTTLTLNKDETYSLSQEYLNKNLKLEDKGKLQWSKDGGSIKITTEKNGRFNYKVGENRLFSLDQEGKEITGPLAEHYVLTKK